MDQRYCPACGHALNNADERGVVAVTKIGYALRFTCNVIECINFLLEQGWEFYGTAKSPQVNTCQGDCA